MTSACRIPQDPGRDLEVGEMSGEEKGSKEEKRLQNDSGSGRPRSSL